MAFGIACGALLLLASGACALQVGGPGAAAAAAAAAATVRGNAARIAIVGPCAEAIGPQLAQRLGAREIVVDELMKGRKGRKTDKVKAEAISKAFEELDRSKSWVLRGFPSTAAQAEALQTAGVTLDRLVLAGGDGDGDKSGFDDIQRIRGVDLRIIPQNTAVENVDLAVEGALLELKCAEREDNHGDGSGQSTPSELPSSPFDGGSVPWYAAVAQAQQPKRRRGGRSQEGPQVHSDPVSGVVQKLGQANGVDWSSGGEMEFGGLQLAPPMSTCLKQAGIVSPTGIQSAAMRAIAAGDNVILHAMTGSGKTLAFLLPLVGRLKPKVPVQVLIVVPTRELAVQVSREVVLLLGGSTSSVELMVSPDKSTGIGQVTAPVVVGTAKALVKALRWTSPREREAALDGLTCLVCDEVDRLVDPLGKYASVREVAQRSRHPKPITSILEKVTSLRPQIQIVACSATVGRPLCRELARMCNVKLATIRETPSPDIDLDHSRAVQIPESIQHTIAPLVNDDPDTQVSALAAAMQLFSPAKPLLFLPDAERISRFVLLLQRAGVPAMPLHEAMGFKTDTRAHTSQIIARHDELDAHFKGKGGSESAVMLVASQSGARGLHFEGVDVVFILGRTSRVDEYVHIAGRTGRGGSPGHVVSLLTYAQARSLKAWGSMLNIEFQQEGLLERV